MFVTPELDVWRLIIGNWRTWSVSTGTAPTASCTGTAGWPALSAPDVSQTALHVQRETIDSCDAAANPFRPRTYRGCTGQTPGACTLRPAQTAPVTFG
ncbi:hypothetical protein GCM10010346_30170 [Streptomyces chryseus]|uniref:Uncharacterized protein n=1 Tax=Streptomyces chryseus TaxID=68186 RepID=A0ABQ3DM17_9ACTN|nr:hypothetical protein GCM10010346_30170 [Streptomyces chryseus]